MIHCYDAVTIIPFQIVPYGMTFGLCYCTLQVTGRLRDTTPENLLPGGAGLVLVIFGLIGVLVSISSLVQCNLHY